MCLCRIDHRETERIKRSPEREIKCWKVFRVDADGTLRPCFKGVRTAAVPVGEWLISVPIFVFGKRGMRYRAGFHASTKDYAEWLATQRRAFVIRTTFAVREVILRGIETVGRQYSHRWDRRFTHRTWVAREMFVLPVPSRA